MYVIMVHIAIDYFFRNKIDRGKVPIRGNCTKVKYQLEGTVQK
jgi:hypothetical protein